MAPGLAGLSGPGFADRLQPVCAGPPEGAKLSGARRRRNADASPEFHRNFGAGLSFFLQGGPARGAGTQRWSVSAVG